MTRLWLLVLSFACLVLGIPVNGRTLVVYDSTNDKISADAVAKSLENRQHVVTVQSIKASPSVFDYNERSYDNLFIIPGRTKGLGKSLTSRKILDFLLSGGNVVAVTTPEYSPNSVRDAAAQLGIHIGARGVSLVDHFSSGNTVALNASNFINPSILPYYESSGLSITNSTAAYLDDENSLVLPLIRAPSTAYAYNYLTEDDGAAPSQPFALGSEAVVAAGIQTLSNARFAWLGSSDLLSSPYGEKLVRWAFQEDGVLRITNADHFDEDGQTHHVYRVQETITYCVDVEEWTDDKTWSAYSATDLQLEFRMLDPYYRISLVDNPEGSGRHCTEFMIPDRYGMFTFLVDYKRPGKTFLKDSKVVTIRHMANHEWPRSWTLTNSWVYLSSAVIVVAMWLVFVALYFGE